MDLTNINYWVPENWYRDVYRDKKEVRTGARSFSMIHEKKAEECWLFIHGYRGYPGEMVRPAVDLYELGYDVYVPRLPGHGTCGDDFIAAHRNDWQGLSENALNDLKGNYKKFTCSVIPWELRSALSLEAMIRMLGRSSMFPQALKIWR